MEKILLLEDDSNLSKGIQLSLSKEGFSVIPCLTIAAAKAAFTTENFSLIISDISLPDGSGLDFCRDVRRQSNVLILMLTSYKEEYDIVTGYEYGADDYMTKPFSLMVLISKVRALMNRLPDKQARLLISDGLKLNLSEMKVSFDGDPLPLSKTELQLLITFMENPKQILSQEQLLARIWDTKGDYIDGNTISVNISRLRQKIGKDRVKTIRGVGYLWVNDVQKH
ncbi:response regulator transcription factor [Enterococcus sp. HY326]|uniref:response regulator transcription factor n=1 Tax=Enterococcus sp. HY326 TaxID=2971265 RepID=UPI00223FEBC4|nr:response regulator transcription factor [Enterococcus sp. HY326]